MNTLQNSRPIKAKPHQAERKEAGKFPERKKKYYEDKNFNPK